MAATAIDTFINKWAHIAITYKGKIWQLYLNKEPKLSLFASKINLYDNLSIDQLIITTTDPKIIVQVKEIALFGHNRDISEIWDDSGSFIGLNGNFNQMLAYYPLSESAYTILND